MTEKRSRIVQLMLKPRTIPTILIIFFILRIPAWLLSSNSDPARDTYTPLLPQLASHTRRKTNPAKWLGQNSDDPCGLQTMQTHHSAQCQNRPRAAIISLVRNSELAGIILSMTELEARFNHKYAYPWIFFNDEPFTPSFIAATRNLTAGEAFYELVPSEHWQTPSWIDETRFENSLEFLGTIGVGKGWMRSYHAMCRWNSGFFFRHSRLAEFDWYWRVEPDVHFYCNVTYDPFRFMADNELVYGFNMAILDDARSFPSLWAKTRDFMRENPQLLHPQSDMAWLLHTPAPTSASATTSHLDPRPQEPIYNNCQFFSNFEIGSLTFWRSPPVAAYFAHLDQSGGFYYERWGDAPVHTLAVAMFASKASQWFFRDIGYAHDSNSVCPSGRPRNCACESTGIDDGFYRLVPAESRQAKPMDTCIRSWLGGEWLEKREGWEAEIERQWGGDGYGGYVRWE